MQFYLYFQNETIPRIQGIVLTKGLTWVCMYTEHHRSVDLRHEWSLAVRLPRVVETETFQDSLPEEHEACRGITRLL